MDTFAAFFNPFELIDGKRPEIRTAEQRRFLDPEEFGDDSFPENVELLNEFKFRKGIVEDAYFKSSRGLNVFTRTLVPESPVGGVFVCHSYGSNLRHRHKKTMLKYGLQGYVVTGIEYEGHGWSDGVSALVNSAEEMIDDVDDFFQVQRKEFSDLPWIVHGESLGGMVALNVCLRSQERGDVLKGAVLVAPMCMIAPERRPKVWMLGMLTVASRLIPSIALTPAKMSAKDSYRDPEVRAALQKDPVHYFGRTRLGTAREFYAATVKLEEQIPQISTPFFVIHGDKDSVTSLEGSKKLVEWTEMVEEGNKELVVVENGLHGMLWAEEGKEKLWEKMLHWAKGRLV